jgi:hypothetical protein
MQMTTTERSEVLRETEQGKEHRGNPGVDPVPQEFCANDQNPPWDPSGSHVPGEGAFETFVGGAGI